MAAFTWTVERYRKCQAFDQWMKDEMAFPRNRTWAEISKQNPGTARMWQAWIRQKREGTLNCPGWCDRCEGSGMVLSNWREDPDRTSYARPCPACHGSATLSESVNRTEGEEEENG